MTEQKINRQPNWEVDIELRNVNKKIPPRPLADLLSEIEERTKRLPQPEASPLRDMGTKRGWRISH